MVSAFAGVDQTLPAPTTAIAVRMTARPRSLPCIHHPPADASSICPWSLRIALV